MLRHCLVPLIFVLAALLALLSGASAQETFACKAVAEGGAWELPATWVDCNNATPGVNDSATVSGQNAHVTIKSGLRVEVASLSVEESAQLTNAGEIRAVELQVYGNAQLRSTGPLDLTHPAGNRTGLFCQQASIQLSRDLSVLGSSAYVELKLCELKIKGSLNITSDSSNAYLKVSTFSHLSVSGDLSLVGSYASESTFLYWDATVEVGGDLRLATRSDLNPAGLAQPSTGSVVAAFLGGQLSVGGDLEIKSGDALVTATGPAGLISGFPLYGELEDAFPLPSLDIDEEFTVLGARGSIVIGGSMVVSSGSITGLPDDDFTAGLAAFSLAGSELTASSVSVVSGHGHNGHRTTSGGSAADALLLLGLNAKLIVAKDVLVKSGDGGNGASDTANGGDSAQANFAVIAGGEALIGGYLHILAGSGGNASLARGGAGGAGTVSVAGDQLVSSGSGGTGAIGGSARSPSVVLSGQAFLIGPVKKRVEHATRQFGGLPSIGGINLRVGGDLSILSGNAASSIAEGASGASCTMDSMSGIGGGGLIVYGAWEAEVVIGGDLRLTGCSGGNSVGGEGGLPAMAVGILVMSDTTFNVYGSVEVVGGNGGSVVGGSQDAAAEAQTFLVCFDSALIDIAGSLTITRGNSGDVVNGTGQVQSEMTTPFSGLLMVGDSHLVVGGGKGAITLTGGRGGNVDAAATEGSSGYGGPGSNAQIGAFYRSSITAGDVRIVGGDSGNSFTNSSGGGATKRAATDGAQKRATWSDLFPGEHDFERWHQERAPGDLSLDFLNFLVSGSVLVGEAYSTITVNGKLEILPGAAGATNLLPPQPGRGAALVAAAHSSIVLNGDALISAAAGGRTESSDVPLGEGGAATIVVVWGSNLTARGDIVLQAGDASRGPNATVTGTRGSASVLLTDLSRFDQSGLVSLKDGVGLVNETVVTIDVSRSEWTVYPCPDAGLEMSGERNSSAFVVEAFGTFRDCRGSGAKQGYPEPTVVGSADGSCSPCTCSEASFSSCPAASSASGLHHNSPLGWLLALF